MKKSLFAGVGALALGFAGPAFAAVGGNLVLTGHDDDYHCFVGDGNACNQLGVMATFARDGSSLPVLAIDNGGELLSSLTNQGIPYVAVTPGAVTAGMFNNSVYSAFAVASVTSCGGCDNPTGTGTQLATFSAAIDNFFNNGGGILGLTGAGDSNAFAYVPQAAAGTPIFHSSGFAATPAGQSAMSGFQAVNGDETHNIFTSFAGYTVAEVDTTDNNAAVTIFVQNGTITCQQANSCTITGGTVPEPISLSLLGVGLFGLGVARRYRRK